jgi:hypothetical protein
MELLPVPTEGATSSAFACSADGSTILGWAMSPAGTRAAIWRGDSQARSVPDLLLTDFNVDVRPRVLETGNHVSADGLVIAGDSFGSDGLLDPWIARLDPTADCPCDFDRSSPAIDERDVAAFVSAWFDQEPATDFNGDAVLDIHDILAFLDCWFPASEAQPCSSDPGAGG